MFKTSIAILIAMPLLVSSAAFAETAPSGQAVAAPPHHAVDRVAWHKKVCGEIYAHQAGRLAYLEAKLSLTSQQRPAWSKWQQAKLDTAAKERSVCLDAAPKVETRPNALERDARMEKFLVAKLQGLQASRPMLEALYEQLTPEQKTAFDRNSRHHGHGHWNKHGGSGHGHDGKAG